MDEKKYTLDELHAMLQNLDKSISNQAVSNKKETEDMAKEQRRIIIGWNDDGTPIRKHLICSSQDEMNDKIVKAYVESGRIFEFMKGEVKKKTGTTLGIYSSQWLDRKRKLKPTTRVNYEKYIKTINQTLGKKDLSDISVGDVQKLLDNHKDLSHKTLKDMLGLLKQIMKYAVSDGLISKNPCDSVDLEIPSDKVNVRDALPIDQFKDILAGLTSLETMDRRYLALVMYTGIRRGEALGLKWEDIDFEKNEIHICRNVTHPQQNQPVISSPKTKAGFRMLPLDSSLEIFLGEKIDGKVLTGYVIGGDKPLTLSAFRAMNDRIKAKIDLHGATAHVLRHSYLTYAVGETTDFKTIQGISGHADVGTLINRYAHPQEDKIRSLAEKMHERLTL